MSRRIDISWKTIIFITVFLLGLWLIYLIKDVILLFFVAFIFMSAMAPLVNRLVRLGVPKIVAVLFVFLLVMGSLVGLLTAGFTPLITQTSRLSDKLADTISMLVKANFIDQNLLNQELSTLSRQLINFTFSIFENIIGFVSVIVITLYMLLDREKIEEKAASLFVGHQERVHRLIERIENKLGAWLRGQLILSAVIGALVYIGLTILGIDFALPLAIIAALLEVVPVLGPIIAAIPAVLLALTVSPVLAAAVAGLYLAIQQIEGHLVVPQVMKRAVGLNPLLVILAISIGSRLLGLAGALLAVPIAVVIQIGIEEFLNSQQV